MCLSADKSFEAFETLPQFGLSLFVLDEDVYTTAIPFGFEPCTQMHNEATSCGISVVLKHDNGKVLMERYDMGRLLGQGNFAKVYFSRNLKTGQSVAIKLTSAVDFWHSRGVYHRELKPENLMLDENGSLEVSDFGLSALAECKRQDGLLHTTCGTPAYVAPEIISRKGYNGAKADIWSCGVILFVLLGGYLPFHDSNLMEIYRKIAKADYRCPHWFLVEVRGLLSKILDANPNTRISIAKIMENFWF
ncbi:hypothetical protein L1049_017427 [Liquidambar formosana]|uniref:Protein kinase domain-containing protein n=1 Tax=Liquidambar formosana TaxID=63359 RepID=A0AAP0X3Q2_LIQFO